MRLEDCVVEFPAEWEGSSDVADDDTLSVLTLNGEHHVLSSGEDVFLSGVHGILATVALSWSTASWGCSGVRFCPMESAVLRGPWRDDPCDWGGWRNDIRKGL